MSVMRHISYIDSFSPLATFNESHSDQDQSATPTARIQKEGGAIVKEEKGKEVRIAREEGVFESKSEPRVVNREKDGRSGGGNGDLPKVGLIQFADDESSCRVLVGPELDDGSRLIMRTIDANGQPKMQDHIIVCGAVHNLRQILYCLKNLRSEAIEGTHLWKRIVFMAVDIPEGFEEGVCTMMPAEDFDGNRTARVGSEGAKDEETHRIRVYFRGTGMGAVGSSDADARTLLGNS